MIDCEELGSLGETALDTEFFLFCFSFHPVYHGTSHTHKVNKLTEMTCCELRLYASNEAGDGPYSPIFSFYTTKAPPPAVKGNIARTHSCYVFNLWAREMNSMVAWYLVHNLEVKDWH